MVWEGWGDSSQVDHDDKEGVPSRRPGRVDRSTELVR